MRKFLLPIIALLFLTTCSNLDEADLTDRHTFIKFFDGPYNFSAVDLELIPGGYAILGNVAISDQLTICAIIETDEKGNRIGDIHYFDQEGITGSSFKPIINGGTLSSYVLVGDSIRVDPFEPQGANIVIASLKLLLVNSQTFAVTKKYVRTDNRQGLTSNDVRVDYFGRTLTLADDGSGRIFVLGGLKEGVVGQQAAPELTQLIEFNSALDSLWAIEYDINDRTYQNSKTLIHQNGKIIWASGLAIDVAGFNTSYVTIPVAEEESTFINFSQIGQTTDQKFVPGDISTAANSAFGYGVTGTYSIETNGLKGNVFFLKVNQIGDIIPASIRYFDGGSGVESLADPTVSNTLDGGEAITSTTDGGFVIAGTTILTSGTGKDVWLLKIGPGGEAAWSKTFGGEGDEVPTTIRELPSGEILVCGTKTLGGLSSIFMMKTDKNGDLNN